VQDLVLEAEGLSCFAARYGDRIGASDLGTAQLCWVVGRVYGTCTVQVTSTSAAPYGAVPVLYRPARGAFCLVINGTCNIKVY